LASKPSRAPSAWAVGVALDLDPKHGRALANNADRVFQRGNVLAVGVFERYRRNCRPVVILDPAAAFRGAVERRVVDDDDPAVARGMNIDLHLVRAQAHAVSDREQAVFRPEQGAAAMRDDVGHSRTVFPVRADS
jgi:hypothetical protein